MSEVTEFMQKLYKLSESFKIDEVDELIQNKFDIFTNIGKYDYIDSILYGLDLSKIRSFVAKSLISKCYYLADKLIMNKDFTERAIEHFGKNAL